MKHIVLFSGGSASSYLAYMISQKEKKEDIILLHTPTFSEHPDADRFRRQVSDYVGLPITEAADGRDLWKLIDDNHCLPSQFIPFCTRKLKQEPAMKFYKSLSEDFIIYVGYGRKEWRRVQKQSSRFESMGLKSDYPLFYNNIDDQVIKDTIKNEWGICLPITYLYLNHNNCLPCFKGGKSHFYKIWEHFPEYFQKAVKKEEEIGHTVFKDFSLKQLAKSWEENKQLTFLEDDNLPCLCSI